MSAATKAWRPPMGWNSWDSYGTTVTEAEVLANARFMAEHLLDAGWDTLVIDIDWYDPTARAHGYNENAPLILDEYGCFEGIITLEDVLETLLGEEITDEKDLVADMQQLAREKWLERNKK